MINSTHSDSKKGPKSMFLDFLVAAPVRAMFPNYSTVHRVTYVIAECTIQDGGQRSL